MRNSSSDVNAAKWLRGDVHGPTHADLPREDLDSHYEPWAMRRRLRVLRSIRIAEYHGYIDELGVDQLGWARSVVAERPPAMPQWWHRVHDLARVLMQRRNPLDAMRA
jgi:hypothetical protein